MSEKKSVDKIVKLGNARKWLRAAIAVAIMITSAFIASDVPASAGGATQISGIGYFAAAGECTDPVPGYDFALNMTGDLGGCVYVFVETAECSPSGTYRETGREIYVGGGGEGDEGTFGTTYRFEAKYEDCPNLVGEIFGRCQHPIVAGSGTGDFSGVSGRFDMKDDIVGEDISFRYRGHLRW